eukprot:366031-Chlamydomonas_euryale.AAC.6
MGWHCQRLLQCPCVPYRGTDHPQEGASQRASLLYHGERAEGSAVGPVHRNLCISQRRACWNLQLGLAASSLQSSKLGLRSQ